MVADSKRSATFCAATCKNLAAVFSSHSFAEAMFVDTAAIGGLECSFHCYSAINYFVREIARGLGEGSVAQFGCKVMKTFLFAQIFFNFFKTMP